MNDGKPERFSGRFDSFPGYVSNPNVLQQKRMENEEDHGVLRIHLYDRFHEGVEVAGREGSEADQDRDHERLSDLPAPKARLAGIHVQAVNGHESH